MELSYRVLDTAEELGALYARLQAEHILWALWPEYGEGMSEQDFVARLSSPTTLVLGGYIDGRMAGALTLCPWGDVTQIGEVGLTAFRESFAYALPLCRTALLWCYAHLELACMVGRVPVTNRHSLRLLAQAGFRKECRLPGMKWSDRLQRFTDGWLVVGTRERLEEAEDEFWRRRTLGAGTAAGKAADQEPFSGGCCRC